MANKKLVIKHFADLKMHGVAQGTPQHPDSHPASKHKRGSKLMDHTDMQDEGDTGFSAKSKQPNPFDKKNAKKRF